MWVSGRPLQCAVVGTLLAIGLLSSRPADAQVVFEIRALEDVPLPDGLPADSFSQPRIDAAGQVAFTTTDFPDRVFGPDANGDLALLAANNAPAPGTGANFQTLEDVLLAPTGHVGFLGTLDNSVPSSLDEGLWVTNPIGTPTLVVQSGMQAPGLPAGAVFTFLFFFDDWALNGAGEIILKGNLALGSGGVTTSNDEGIWTTGGGGGLALLARRGSVVPSDPLGPVFGHPRTGLGLNDLGEGTFADSSRVFGPDPATGAPTVRVRQGDVAPGTSGGVFVNGFHTFQFGGVNDAREITFMATSQAPAKNPKNGAWGPDGSGSLLVPVLQSADTIDPPDTEFRDPFSGSDSLARPQMNASGQVAFRAPLKLNVGVVTEETDTCIWIWQAGSRTVIVREGDLVPDLAGGVRFRALDGPSLNNAGELLFAADLVDGGVTPGDDRALFFSESDGTLHTLLREGHAMNVGPGDDRTVMSFFVIDPFDVRVGARSLNDAGQVAMRVEFTDGSEAIVVASLATPPAVPGVPGWLGVFSAAWVTCLGALALRRHGRPAESRAVRRTA